MRGSAVYAELDANAMGKFDFRNPPLPNPINQFFMLLQMHDRVLSEGAHVQNYRNWN